MAAVQHWHAVFIKTDRLMSAIPAGDHTASAADAPIMVKFREKDRIPFQIVCVQINRIYSQSDCFTDIAETFFGDEAAQSGFQVIDNAVTVLHDCSCYLQLCTAEQDKFESVPPGFDPAHAADVHPS